MPKRIAIVGGSPTWRRGMAAGLTDTGLAPVEVDELESWSPGRDGAAVVAAVPAGDTLEALAAFAADYPAVPLIAVLPEMTVSRCAEVVRAGAAAAVAEDEPVAVFSAVVAAGLAGRASVPVTILRAMAARIPATPDPTAWVDEREIGWLRSMAAGATVAELADAAGYSEREVFRMLRETYARIGATTRTEAIIWATRHGLLDTEPTA